MGNVIIPVGVSSGGASKKLGAGPFDVLDGYTFVGPDGKKVTGAIPSKSAATIIPGNTPQVINSGYYLSGDQIIKGDSNLIASNIRKGVTLFGIHGTYVPPLRLGVTASDHSLITSIWLDPGDDLYSYQSDGIHFTPRRYSSGEEYYSDLPRVNAYVAFSPLIDFSQYSRITFTGYMDSGLGCFATHYNDFVGPEISYDYRNWRFLNHNQYASEDGRTGWFDISSENSTGYLLLVFQFRDLDSDTYYVFPGRTFVLTSVTLT